MLEDKRVYAIIGAAGSGKRMAAPLPKQFLKINGKTILETTVEKFEKNTFVDEIVVVTAKEYIKLCCQFFSGKKNIRIVEGGKERQDSIYEGIKALHCDPADIVLVHDGARPFVQEKTIDAVCMEAKKTGAAIAAVPTKDTIRHIEDGTLDRKSLYNVQTPQGFTYEIIKEAFDRAMGDRFYGTDDASLVERLGRKVSIVSGEEGNIKITTQEDLKGMLTFRTGSGYDVHRLVEGRRLILGGVEIPWDLGLDGHSDADVLVHALMDALLGAAALGDIGGHFPDTDEAYKGISSIRLLEHVSRLLENEGYNIGNVDVTVICQQPKLKPYIEEMRRNLAEAMSIDIGKVSVKATTTEKLGFAGRGEGIAAEAVCLLNR